MEEETTKKVARKAVVEEEEEEADMEKSIAKAMRERVGHFKEQADSLTLEGVRRALEKDLGLETFALDVHKRFIKQCLQEGSERLLLLVTDSSERLDTRDGKGTSHEDEKLESHDSLGCPLILKPSKELEKLLGDRDNEKGLSKSTLADICKAYHLDTNAVLKYQNSV